MKEKIESHDGGETPKRKPLSVIIHSLTASFRKLLDGALDKVFGNPDDIGALDFVGTSETPRDGQKGGLWEHRLGQGTRHLVTSRGRSR